MAPRPATRRVVELVAPWEWKGPLDPWTNPGTARQTSAVPKRKLEELTWDECFELLKQEVVGRLVYHDESGPAAAPVNYVLAGHDIVFRTEDGSKVRALRESGVAFEADDIDVAGRSGWSVLVRGTCEEIALERVPELLRRIGGDLPLPWKKGVHKIWVVITPKTVTGRRLADYAFDDFF